MFCPYHEGQVLTSDIEIYYAVYGSGQPLILLHGGHGRSTRDDQAYSYHLLVSDVLAVMDILSIPKASIVGWSDGGVLKGGSWPLE